ncbi:hypothetical protein KU306_01925 [Haloferax larsenii]|uniref:Uncharacterized protein n=1 Tax=Haloferax larsenii TaxID=302484 RepID=A0ABY5RL93_HALLR|nr:hypothetical protein KU306_01925 [Haloferax larsenii]
MGQPHRSRFCDRFRAASASERRQFVADLWDARGWETTIEADLVVARRGNETVRIAAESGPFGVSLPSQLSRLSRLSRFLRLSHPSRLPRLRRLSRFSPLSGPPQTADVVVTLDDAESTAARCISPGDLYEIARYGIPEADSNDLFQTHFGDALDDPAPELPRTQRTPSSTATALGLVVALAVLLAVVGLPGSPLALDAQTGETRQSPTAAGTPEATPTPEPRVVAPGVTSAGIQNASVLAAAHRDAVTNHSYEWTLGYRESIAGDETGREVEVVRVERPHVYSVETQRAGRLRAYPRPTSAEDSFADGTYRYSRRPMEPDGFAVRVIDPDVLDGPGRQATRAERYVEWYLSTGDSRVVNTTTDGGMRVYRVVGRGTDFPRSRQYEVVALVEEDGFVRSLTVTYETRDGLGITVWFEYDDVDETRIETPPWVSPIGRSTPATVALLFDVD